MIHLCFLTHLATLCVDCVLQVDRLLEALEIWKNESDELREYKEECRLSGKELPPPKQHPILVALGNIKVCSGFICVFDFTMIFLHSLNGTFSTHSATSSQGTCARCDLPLSGLTSSLSPHQFTGGVSPSDALCPSHTVAPAPGPVAS